MSDPVFLLQIADGNGAVAQLPAGGALEVDLIAIFRAAISEDLAKVGVTHQQQIDRLTEAIIAKGVGFFRTEAHVEQDIREALSEVVTSVDSGLHIDAAIGRAIHRAILSLKEQSRFALAVHG